MADDSPPGVTPRSHDVFAHPRISGGDGSSLDQAVTIDSTGMEMALMLIQLYLERALGTRGRDWVPVTERWVDSVNRVPSSVLAVGVELADGTQREYYFCLDQAVSSAPPPIPGSRIIPPEAAGVTPWVAQVQAPRKSSGTGAWWLVLLGCAALGACAVYFLRPHVGALPVGRVLAESSPPQSGHEAQAVIPAEMVPAHESMPGKGASSILEGGRAEEMQVPEASAGTRAEVASSAGLQSAPPRMDPTVMQPNQELLAEKTQDGPVSIEEAPSAQDASAKGAPAPAVGRSQPEAGSTDPSLPLVVAEDAPDAKGEHSAQKPERESSVEGRLIPMPRASAEELRERTLKRAEAGDPVSQMDLSWAYAVGTPLVGKRDDAQVALWDKRAQSTGHPYALLNVEYRGSRQLPYFQRVADEGDARAQYLVGLRLQEAGGKEQMRQAKGWFQKSADQGYPLAQRDLGAMYLKAYSQSKDKGDKAQAMRWCKAAANAGEEEAMTWLGTLYMDEGKYEDALEWVRSGAERGHATAHGLLSTMYLNGRAVPQDQIKGLGCVMTALRLDSRGCSYLKPKMEELIHAMSTKDIAEASLIAAGFEARPRVYCIESDVNRALRESKPKAWGAGFFIREDGYFITSMDCVHPKSRIFIMNQGRFYDAYVSARSLELGLVLLKAEAAVRALALPLRPSLEDGDKTYLIGRLPGGMRDSMESYTTICLAPARVLPEDALAEGERPSSVPLQGPEMETGLVGAPVLLRNGAAGGIVYPALPMKASRADGASGRAMVLYRDHPFRLPPVTEPWYDQSVANPQFDARPSTARDLLLDAEAASGLVLVYE